MNAKANFSYDIHPRDVREIVKLSGGGTMIVDGYGRQVVDPTPAPKTEKHVEFVTVGQGRLVHKNTSLNRPLCGTGGTGSGSRGYDIEVHEASSNVVTCQRCLSMMNN